MALLITTAIVGIASWWWIWYVRALLDQPALPQATETIDEVAEA